MSDALTSLRALLDIMSRLRDPNGGCPWDLEQTFSTIAPYTIEEAYEVADAIEGGEPEKIRDELGDLLFQVVFHARMAEEKGWFDFNGVAEAIATKLIHRHPHVFADQKLETHAALNRQWEDLKERERAAKAGAASSAAAASQVLADVPRALPALTRAAKLGKRAARIGFDWPDTAGVRAKIEEELRELEEALHASAGSRDGEMGAPAGSATLGVAPVVGDGDVRGPNAAIAEEFGDLLFTLVNYSRHLNLDPEGALRAANAKFERRFAAMESLARNRGLDLKKLSPTDWDGLWTQAKTLEKA